MTPLGPALLILLTTLLRAPVPPPPMPVLTTQQESKSLADARHAVVSFAAAAQGYGVARGLGLSRDGAAVTSLVVAAALGVGKELWDVHRGDRIEPIDLVWDAVGLALGAVMIGAMR